MGKPTFDTGVQRSVSVPETVFRNGFSSPCIWFLISSIQRRYELPNKIGGFKRTRGTETSQYLEERTSTETPLVVASERGPGQWRFGDNRKRLEWRALVGDSPVRVMQAFVLE